MILTRDAILAEIAAGNVCIEPFEAERVGPASVDLHLGDELRVLDDGKEPIDVREDIDYHRFSRVVRIDAPFVLAPGTTVLGITRERIRLAPNICGWLEGRSRFARIGLMIHVTAGFLSPGIDNRQVLEISNLARRPLVLHAGVSVCQIVLQRAEGGAVYSGRFANQLKL
jgi:dCTP deaminase